LFICFIEPKKNKSMKALREVIFLFLFILIQVYNTTSKSMTAKKGSHAPHHEKRSSSHREAVRLTGKHKSTSKRQFLPYYGGGGMYSPFSHQPHIHRIVVHHHPGWYY
jgi:hypothetical protein